MRSNKPALLDAKPSGLLFELPLGLLQQLVKVHGVLGRHGSILLFNHQVAICGKRTQENTLHKTVALTESIHGAKGVYFFGPLWGVEDVQR